MATLQSLFSFLAVYRNGALHILSLVMIQDCYLFRIVLRSQSREGYRLYGHISLDILLSESRAKSISPLFFDSVCTTNMNINFMLLNLK